MKTIVLKFTQIMRQYHTIRIEKSVADKLDELRAPGQSYNGVLEELIDLAEKVGFGRVADKLHLMRPSEGPPLPKKTGRRWKKK